MYRGQNPQESRQAWQERIHEAAARAEEDLRHVVQYINDEVVPDVRRHGSAALRVAAQELHKLAHKLDEYRTPPPPPPGPGEP